MIFTLALRYPWLGFTLLVSMKCLKRSGLLCRFSCRPVPLMILSVAVVTNLPLQPTHHYLYPLSIIRCALPSCHMVSHTHIHTLGQETDSNIVLRRLDSSQQEFMLVLFCPSHNTRLFRYELVKMNSGMAARGVPTCGIRSVHVSLCTSSNRPNGVVIPAVTPPQ